MTQKALQKLDARWQAGGRICVGLDSRFDSIPLHLKKNGPYVAMNAFNRHITNATGDVALAYKMNMAPYLCQGVDGIRALIDTFAYIREKFPDVLTILDCKSGDALNDINDMYARFAFEVCGADAMTAQVYAGGDAAEGFTRWSDKLIFFLAKTSNEGSGDLQDLKVVTENGDVATKSVMPLYQKVALDVVREWNTHGNCGLVVGATYPKQMEEIRALVGDMPILCPGIGKQAGEFEKTIKTGIVTGKGRLVINEGRSIIFAPYDAKAQRHDEMTFAKAARGKFLERTKEYNGILKMVG